MRLVLSNNLNYLRIYRNTFSSVWVFLYDKNDQRKRTSSHTLLLSIKRNGVSVYPLSLSTPLKQLRLINIHKLLYVNSHFSSILLILHKLNAAGSVIPQQFKEAMLTLLCGE